VKPPWPPAERWRPSRLAPRHSGLIQSADFSLADMRWLEPIRASWTGLVVRKRCSEQARTALTRKPLLDILGLALLVALLGRPADAVAEGEVCFSPWEIQEAVAQGKVIEPKAALLAARRAAPDADVMRGRLCRFGGALVYHILVLRKDGRLIQMTIDAPSGKVMKLQ
jgi:hypothetical protein